MEIQKVAILGSGRLGRGIAENAAAQGYEIILFSQGAKSKNAPSLIERSLAQKVSKWAITESEKRVILSKISYSSDLKELADVDLVIEATIDHLYTKQELLRTADHLCRPEVVFLSTTSTLNVSELSRGINRSELLVGVHFIPPVPKTDLVELCAGVSTADEAIQTAIRFAESLGKQVVEVEESPGFVHSRAMLKMINEAAYILDEGAATAEAVEDIHKQAFGMPQGPFEMADRIGLDIVVHWMGQLREKLGDSFAPCPLLTRYVRQGRLGVKSGSGFFRYTQNGQKKPAADLEDNE